MKSEGQGTGEFSTDTFLVLCYKCGLTRLDLEDMTIGMCLDYIDEYVEMQKPSEEKFREASQAEFDAF